MLILFINLKLFVVLSIYKVKNTKRIEVPILLSRDIINFAAVPFARGLTVYFTLIVGLLKYWLCINAALIWNKIR